ncbi:ABC transporter ATP-binding protein [Mycoplasmopsis lipofaciens]|uniref:ABC transporter ATP-binding protein n=1 Tax=Mycoplasmopsis lipofaciens TaxID=114884 RepID=UPI00048812D3|nr:ABC transporter ATP-binding protein [Mycoplasmopsis lipofaciens]
MNKQKNKVKKISTFSLLKLIFRFLDIKDKNITIFGIILASLNGILYNVGILFTGLIVSLTFETNDKAAFKNPSQFNLNLFIILSTIMALSFIFYGICRFFQGKIFAHIAYKTAFKMRKIAMEKVMEMTISYYDNQKSGDIISTLVNDINNLSNSLLQLLNETFSNIFNILFSFILMMLYSPTLTLIIIFFATMFFSVSYLLIARARPAFIRLQNDFANLNAYTEEMLTNAKITQTFDKQETAKKEFKKIAQTLYKNAVVGDTYSKLFDPWFIFANNILVLITATIALAFKTNSISTFGIFTKYPDTGFIIAFISLIFNFSGTFQMLINVVFSVQLGVASTKRIFKLIDLVPPKKLAKYEELKNIKGLIEFENVSFRYNLDKSKYQITDASFIAKPGQTIAIVGPTGAGKTTIINLLCKFYEYESGSIKIDGIELKHISKENLRDLVAVVLQDSFMFNDTVYNNLKVSKVDATKEEVVKVTSLLSAHQFIQRMENGYDTIIQNNGSSLSQGERQLLSISRAIMGDKKILIMDEATSNVDSNTEQIIQKALQENIMQNKTCIVIAHRLSTIKNADLILVVKDGKIIEKGTHQELINLKGYYNTLYKSQFN